MTPKRGVIGNQQLANELIDLVQKQITPIAKPNHIQWTEDLPKTRSGKIMRRILRKIVNGETEELGDVSTLSNPETIKRIIKQISTRKSS